MSSRKAGIITINLEAGVSKFMTDVDAAKDKVREFGTDGASHLHGAGKAFEAFGVSAAAGLASLSLAGKGMLEFGASALSVAQGLAAYGAGLAVYGAQSEQLLNIYRGLRMALSPTLFTAGTLAVGLAVEETIKLVSARAKLIEQDALIAARDNRDFSSISTFSTAGRISGKGEAIYDTLGGLSPAAVTEAIERIATLADPLDRAREAVRLFGAEGAAALPLLTDNMKRTIERSYELATQIDGPTRESLQRMRDVVGEIGAGFHSVGDDFRYLKELVKQGIVIEVTHVERWIQKDLTPSEKGKDGKEAKEQAESEATAYGERFEPVFAIPGVFPSTAIFKPKRPSDLEFWKMLLQDSGANTVETGEDKGRILSIGKLSRVPGLRAYGPLLPGQVDTSVGSRAGAAADSKAADAYAKSLEGVQAQLSAAKARSARLRDILAFSSGDTALIDGQLAQVTEQVKRLEAQAKEMERAKAFSERMSHFVAKFPDNPLRPRGPSLYRPGEPGRAEDFGIQPGTLISSEKDRDTANAGMTAAEHERLKAYGEGLLADYAANDLTKIKERIEATKRLTAAQLEGAEAARRVALENKYAEMGRSGVRPEVIAQHRQADTLAHEEQITAKAAERLNVYKDRLNALEQEARKLQEIQVTEQNRLDIERVARELEDERLKVLSQEALSRRSAQDGMRAFFLDMQQQAKSSASIVYEAMHSAVDRSSTEIANLMTGRKTNFGKMFQDLGHQMAESSVKTIMQTGLGKLGKVAGISDDTMAKLGLAKKKDGQQQDTAFWVQLAAGGSTPPADKQNVAGTDSSPYRIAFATGRPDGSQDNPFWVEMNQGGSDKNSANGGGGILSILGGLLGSLSGSGGGGAAAGGGGAAAGGVESVDSSIEFLASGGSVDPGSAYMVGEEGPEMFVPSRRGAIIPNSALGGNTFHAHYHIDARGADLGAQNRIARGIEASHKAAVATAIQANHERMKRVPKG